jgi:hypothetical protein
MREWRASHFPTTAQRRKDAARSIAGVYLRRGQLTRRPCQVCGDPRSEMHHPDYDRPLLVRWLCRSCHLTLHRLLRLIENVKQAA